MNIISVINLISAFLKEDLTQSLNILWQGMAAIFIVIAAIFLVTLILNRTFAVIEAKKQEKLAAKEKQEALDEE